jgi:hypothetical protein
MGRKVQIKTAKMAKIDSQAARARHPPMKKPGIAGLF